MNSLSSQAAVEQSMEVAHQREAVPGVVVRRPAQPALEDERVDVRHLGEVVGDVGDVGERVVAERELPVDEPQPLSVEQDVARVDVVVGGHLRGRAGVLGADPGQAGDVPVEDAGREQPAVAHEVQHHLDERAEVLHHRGNGAVACSRATISPSVRRRAGSPPGNAVNGRSTTKSISTTPASSSAWCTAGAMPASAAARRHG